ncbi:MAG: TonB-dependent receptor [Haliea sp.]|nr:TonB-dependent receptor [Haliea sp.]
MQHSFTPRALTLAVVFASAAVAVPTRGHDLAIELVEVTAQADPLGHNTLLSEAPITRPTHDAGELLRSVTGMTALRRGGRGFDPIIRGQSQSSLNVVANGAYSYGACPGRMDPPSTYIGVDSFDSVSVIKGHRSVIYGAGGSGGTLIFEHLRPELGSSGFTGSVTTGYTSNSDLGSLSTDFSAGNERGYVRVFGALRDSGNYEDGNGQAVASAFESRSAGLVAGIDLLPNSYLEISHERANEDDVWYAGNGMDAVFADSSSTSAKWLQQSLGPIDTLELSAYRSDVDHLMDNYSVRNRSMMPAGAAAPSRSETWGGRLLATLAIGQGELRSGLDYRANDRGAELYMDNGKDGSYDMLLARMWPDAQQRQAGVFAELDYQTSTADTWRLALRADRFESQVREAQLSAGMTGSATPTHLYQQFYDTTDTRNDDNGISAILGWDRRIDDANLISVNLSRSVRTPDSSEQWIARSAGGNFWVGNPTLNAEIHQQLDLTMMHEGDRVDWSASLFVDDINDYIERYAVGSADLYRNIDATLFGSEVDASLQVNERLRARLGIAYTRGHGDNGDLAQIAPLEARANLDYQHNRWALGLEWVATARQSHFNSAVDVDAPTPGFGVVHLYSHWNVSGQLLLEAGIENLFDKAYSYHVNAGNLDPFNPEAVRVNEPGRQGWVKLRYSF